MTEIDRKSMRSIKQENKGKAYLPRLGMIKLGVKLTKEKNGEKIEYPSEVDYFVVPEEVQKIFGEKPKELRIMFPSEDIEMIASRSFKYYGSNRLRCKGNGEDALCYRGDLTKNHILVDEADREGSEHEQVYCQCPCPLFEQKKGGCNIVLDLMFMIPEVSLGGIYQISTGSHLNRQRVDDYIAYLNSLVGRISRLPLKMSREETKTTYIDNDNKRKTSTHHLLKFDFLGNANDLQRAISDKNSLSTQSLLLAPPSEEGEAIEPDVIDLEEDIEEAEIVTDFFQVFSEIRSKAVKKGKVDEFNELCLSSFGSVNPNEVQESHRQKLLDKLGAI